MLFGTLAVWFCACNGDESAILTAASIDCHCNSTIDQTIHFDQCQLSSQENPRIITCQTDNAINHLRIQVPQLQPNNSVDLGASAPMATLDGAISVANQPMDVSKESVTGTLVYECSYDGPNKELTASFLALDAEIMLGSSETSCALSGTIDLK